MNCRNTQRHSSAYLDGDLDFETSAAVRGHLRGCDECAEMVESEQRVAGAARELDAQIDPPADLWRRINAEVARREVDDASDSSQALWVRRWWSKARPYWAHGVVSVGLAAAVALLVVKSQADSSSAVDSQPTVNATDATNAGESESVSSVGLEPNAQAADQEVTESHMEAAMAQIRRSDERYLTAIGDLREIADSEKIEWTKAQRSRFESRNRQFERRVVEIEKKIATVTKSEDSKRYDPRQRDPLYKLYRQHLEFLEENVFGNLAAVSNSAMAVSPSAGAVQ